jgi:transcriptional regulator with XRE-family HTH domain
MKIKKEPIDSLILSELGGRIAKYRLDQNKTQEQLATEAGIAKRTLRRLEAGEVATQLSTLIRVCRVLGLLEGFAALIPEPVPSPIAKLKARGLIRRRASRIRPTTSGSQAWTWGNPT